MEKKKRGRPKRKAEEEVESIAPAKLQQVCILHYDASSCDTFTLLADLKDPEERFKKLLDIRDLRLSQPLDSKQRMESVCRLLPTELGEGHGYHRDCYNHFTKNVERLKSTESTELVESSKKAQRKLSVDKIALFAKDCIFCNIEGRTNVRKGGVWTTGARRLDSFFILFYFFFIYLLLLFFFFFAFSPVWRPLRYVHAIILP